MEMFLYTTAHDVKTGIKKTNANFQKEVGKTHKVRREIDGSVQEVDVFIYQPFGMAYGINEEPWMNSVWCSKRNFGWNEEGEYLGYEMMSVHWEDLLKAKKFLMEIEQAKLQSDLFWVKQCAEDDFSTPSVERSQLPNPKI